MNAILKQPGKPATELHLPDGEYLLDNLRNLVGGCIEPVALSGRVKCLRDESGMAKQLPGNCGLVGPLVFVATEQDDYGEVGLNSEQKRSVGQWIAANEGA